MKLITITLLLVVAYFSRNNLKSSYKLKNKLRNKQVNVVASG